MCVCAQCGVAQRQGKIIAHGHVGLRLCSCTCSITASFLPASLPLGCHATRTRQSEIHFLRSGSECNYLIIEISARAAAFIIHCIPFSIIAITLHLTWNVLLAGAANKLKWRLFLFHVFAIYERSAVAFFGVKKQSVASRSRQDKPSAHSLSGSTANNRCSRM